MPLRSEIRKQLAPQIEAFQSSCACAVRAGAGRYTKAEADNTTADLENFIAETIAKGTCNERVRLR